MGAVRESTAGQVVELGKDAYRKEEKKGGSLSGDKCWGVQPGKGGGRRGIAARLAL